MAEGGQPQINKEQAVVQQLIQAFAQLSPQGQQMFIQGLQQMMQQQKGNDQQGGQDQGQQGGQDQGQQGGQDQGQQGGQDQGGGQPQQGQPMQRMGGYNNPGFKSLPQNVQQKIMGNS